MVYHVAQLGGELEEREDRGLLVVLVLVVLVVLLVLLAPLRDVGGLRLRGWLARRIGLLRQMVTYGEGNAAPTFPFGVPLEATL